MACSAYPDVLQHAAIAWSRVLAAATAALVLHAAGPSAGAQTATPAPAAPTVPRISATAVERLVEVGSESSSSYFLGIHKIEGGVSLLSISSGRQLIAFAAAGAASKGGRYNPPAAARTDLVFITCGDEDLGERWDCERLAVLNSLGRRVAPLSYSAGPRTYRNALGASWSAVKVTATYRIADLAAGFSVRYAGTDGTEFTEVVSQELAENALLAKLPLTAVERAAAEAAAKAAAAAALAAEPEPPPLLRGSLKGEPGDLWTITSSTPAYVWQKCELVSGSASTSLAPLEPGKPVTVARPKGGLAGRRPSVQCVAKGRRFEGPVPEFMVSVQRDGDGAFVIKNETDWAWSHCEITAGESVADAVPLMPQGQLKVRLTDFSPPFTSTAAAMAVEVSCVTNGQRVKATQTRDGQAAAPPSEPPPSPASTELAVAVERRAADFWIIRNLTDLDWATCEATVGEKSAEVAAFKARTTVTLTASNFRPGPPRADEGGTTAALSFHCIAKGTRVGAVQRPAK